MTMKITKEELEIINGILYNCETCRYPSYRNKDTVFCSCCWRKNCDPKYWEKVMRKHQEIFGVDAEESERNILVEKARRTKKGLTKNKDGYYVKAR